MAEGTVGSWLVEEGAQIPVGMPILEVESDKIANAVEAPDPGLLRRRLAAASDPAAGQGTARRDGAGRGQRGR